LQARSFSLEVIPVPLKLKNLFGYCKTWDTSVALELDHIAELSAGVEMPRIGARLHARISFLSEDWLKASLKEHIMGVSVGLLSTMNHPCLQPDMAKFNRSSTHVIQFHTRAFRA
jgi:outer membrane protein insertion porin family